MNFIFLMDPLDTVVVDKDTTFMLMVGAHRHGHKVFFLPEGGMTRKDNQLFFHATKVIPQITSRVPPFRIQQRKILYEKDVDAVFIRPNPPFDNDYLMNTWLLDLRPKHIVAVNDPAGIRTVNEKIWATQFAGIIPPTVVTRNISEMMYFLTKEKNIIAKPTDAFGGFSIFHIRQEQERNTKVIFETLSMLGQREIILQKYIPQAQRGDKRILLLNGEPLGAVLRVHAPGEHRNNLFTGGKPKAASINKRDLEIIGVLKPHLQALGLYFVGIDIIGDYLIEVNVTSPTCLQEMNRLYNLHLENKVINFVENLVKMRK